jgi:nitronate monooxygenase
MSWPTPALTDLLGIEHPIIQAPMAGASTAALAVAVSNAGALGGFGGTDSSPVELRAVILAIRQLTNRPFIINLYLDRPRSCVPAAGHVAALKAALASVHAELRAGEVPDPIHPLGNFERQIAVVLEERVPVLSSHFGAPDAAVMRALKANGTRVLATGTTIEEARHLEADGIDAIIAQGSEAGGHRGTFAAAAGQAEIGTMALVPQIVDAVSVPVIAAGGIMDGRGIAAATMLGASGVQMGTAFVPCPETAVNPAYVKRLLAAAPGDAVLTDAFSGRPARLLRNQLVTLLEQYRGHRLAFPEQLSMTRNLRKVASATDNADFLPMFAGQGVALARAMPAAELVGSLVAEAQKLFSGDPANHRAREERRSRSGEESVGWVAPGTLSRSIECPPSKRYL